MQENKDKKLIIKELLFYDGIYDYLNLENKIKKLISNISLEEKFYKFTKINFLNIELLTSHEMQHIHNNIQTTDVLTFVYPRANSKEIDVSIYLDPLLVFFFIQLDIEFENSYLPQTLENRMLELINHGLFHAIGMDHSKNDINPTMLDYEKLNLIKYIS